MGLQLPEWTRKMFQITIGDGWPEADEDELWALSRVWADLGVAVGNMDLKPMNPVRAVRRNNWDGPAAQVFGTNVEEMNAHLGAAGEGAQAVARFIEETAFDVQYMKIIVMEQLTILAIQIAWLLNSSSETFGASAAVAEGLATQGRLFALSAVKDLALSIPVAALLAVGSDVVAQGVQMARGRRQWNGPLTSAALIGAGIGGVLGPTVGKAGNMVGKRLRPVVGARLADATKTVMAGAGHAYLTTGLTGTALGLGWSGSPWDLTSGAVGGAVEVAGKVQAGTLGAVLPPPPPVVHPPARHGAHVPHPALAATYASAPQEQGSVWGDPGAERPVSPAPQPLPSPGAGAAAQRNAGGTHRPTIREVLRGR